MRDFVDGSAFNFEQGQRARKLFAAVVLAALDDAVLNRGRPFLGICVGMQLMAREGHEDGVTPGLGWLAGSVEAIAPAPGQPVSPIRLSFISRMHWMCVI